MRRIEKRIAARAREFDLQSLIRLLQHHGWSLDEIQFSSHFSATSQASLIHEIEFTSEPSRAARIVLNMGILSAQSPLPSYFIKKMDTSELDTFNFVEFLGYFDHAILSDYLRNLYPETNGHLFTDWELTKRRYLHFLNLKSCSTLHWLLSTVFPELGVVAEKATLPRSVKTTPIQLGRASLGSDAVFGKKTSVPVHGRRITFFSESEIADNGQPWLKEIRSRLEEIVFPIIGDVGIDLEVFLVVKAQSTFAKLHQESYLGYDKVRGGAEQFRRIKIFSGHVVA
jgi:hypothetical protein